ncbi:hypothetical protein AB0M45_21975 [Nocardia sp. NPDC051787]|uniref:hypothetical protein n=1 Tax=Nocardia sp. NPDC051787 TaxID=3155415 RepID=UPI0034471BE7
MTSMPDRIIFTFSAMICTEPISPPDLSTYSLTPVRRAFGRRAFPLPFHGLADLRAETLQTLLQPVPNGLPPLMQRDDIGDRHRLHAFIEVVDAVWILVRTLRNFRRLGQQFGATAHDLGDAIARDGRVGTLIARATIGWAGFRLLVQCGTDRDHER